MVKLKKGIIIGVHDMGSMWSIDVSEKFIKGKPSGKQTVIKGDWRPIRDALNDAFDISSSEFPYVSKKKIYENAIGQEIEFSPDSMGIFGAEAWRPLNKKKFSLSVDEVGRIKRLKEVV
jgi:hypothetical protein